MYVFTLATLLISYVPLLQQRLEPIPMVSVGAAINPTDEEHDLPFPITSHPYHTSKVVRLHPAL